MASLAPVYLPAGVWVDLYDATSITVGTQINAHNAFSPDIYLVEGNTTPAPLKTVPSARDVGVRVIEKGQDRVNRSGATGAWAIAFTDTTLQIEEA